MKKILMIIFMIFLGSIGFLIYSLFSTDNYITSDEAIKIAQNDVANKDGNYNIISVEFKENNDNYIYTLKFSDNVNIYTYKINAKSKRIISSKKELLSNNDIYINEDEILDIVFNNAKLNRNECNLLSNLVVIEENNPIYHTIFYYNNDKYEYKTNAFTGAIISVTKLKNAS